MAPTEHKLQKFEQFAIAEAVGTFDVSPEQIETALKAAGIEPVVATKARGMAESVANSIGKARYLRQPPAYNAYWSDTNLKGLVNEAPDSRVCQIVRKLAGGGKAMSHRAFVSKRFKDLLEA